MKNKNITIKINNKDLDAMEDYLTVDFERDYEEEERCRQITQTIWRKLMKEWDKTK